MATYTGLQFFVDTVWIGLGFSPFRAQLWPLVTYLGIVVICFNK